MLTMSALSLAIEGFKDLLKNEQISHEEYKRLVLRELFTLAPSLHSFTVTQFWMTVQGGVRLPFPRLERVNQVAVETCLQQELAFSNTASPRYNDSFKGWLVEANISQVDFELFSFAIKKVNSRMKPKEYTREEYLKEEV